MHYVMIKNTGALASIFSALVLVFQSYLALFLFFLLSAVTGSESMTNYYEDWIHLQGAQLSF